MIIQRDKNTEKINLLEKFCQAFINREFVSFILCGGINGLSCIGSSMLLAKVLGANLAFILGYIISLFVSYFLNGYITFKRRVNISGFFWFAFSYIPNFIIQNIMVFVMYNDIVRLFA